MRLTSIQLVEGLGVVTYIGLYVWTLALGGKFDIFAWQWKYFEYVWDSETLK